MSQLEDVTLGVIREFLSKDESFTALDVSNKVKETLPMSRHREVRDIVRSVFASEIEPAAYARTNITVTLANGTSTDAMLYHPLVDSWDLDVKYGSDRRASETTGFIKFGNAPVAAPPPPPSAPMPIPAVITVAVSQPVSSTDQWAQLFASAPSLFASK